MGTKDIMSKRNPREQLRPDDADILEKLRVKRTVSIPAVNKPSSASSFSEIDTHAQTEPLVQNEKILEKSVEATPHHKIKEKEEASSISNLPYSPKLVVNGRLPRKKGSSSRSLQLMHSLEEEIKRCCSGGELVVINYLIKLGLEQVKKSETTIFVNADDM
jgi:hypothetical protein